MMRRAILVLFLSCAIPTTVFAGRPVVICTSQSGEPWKLLTTGTLNRVVTGTRTDFELQTAHGVFSWTIEKHLDGSTSITTRGFLMPVLFPRPHTVPRGPIVVQDASLEPTGQFMSASGEIIQETDGRRSLISTPGSTCPPRGYDARSWPNSTVERDARKSGARPSP
jgi:hypothetical protein